jgi:adenylate cyclase
MSLELRASTPVPGLRWPAGLAAATGRALRAFRAGRMVALLVLAALLGLRIADPPLLEALRNRVFDAYQQAKPRAYTPLPVAIIDIDEASLAQIGQWPWSRTVMADLVRRLGEAGVAAVGFDVIFSEPDRMSPARYAKGTGSALPAALAEQLRALPDHDDFFADSLGTVPVVLGRSGALAATPEAGQLPQTPFMVMGQEPRGVLTAYDGLLANLGSLEAAAAGRGLLSFLPETDGVVRRYPVVSEIGGALMPSMGLELLRVATGQQAFMMRTDQAGGVSSVAAGPLVAQTDRNGRTWVYFTPHRQDRFIPAADVLTGRAGPEQLQGRIVLVGASATGLSDIKPTPLESMPGVEVHAQFMETVLTKTALWHPSYALGLELVIMAALSLVVIALVPVLGSLGAATLAGSLMAGAGYASWWAFAEHRTLVDVTLPICSALLVFIVQVFENYRREEVGRERVRGAFQQYLSPALVEQLAHEPERLVLGGENRTMTILFSDVRGFTSLSETYKGDAPGLTRLMNRLLTPLTNAILQRQGTIDKYMGDAIMAFWNAPVDVADHPARSCEAALDMMERLALLNRELKSEAAANGRDVADVAIGIGINTGECVVGNMGSDLRFDYTVLGDAVNLASRLEGQSKAYKVNMIVGAATAQQVEGRFALVEIDLIRVKGKREPERIFALLGGAETAGQASFRALEQAVRAAQAAMRGHRWADALALLEAQRETAEAHGLGGYLDVLDERIAGYRSSPPPADWDGVYEATSK